VRIHSDGEWIKPEKTVSDDIPGHRG
jgi:hypothetical protein